VNPGGHANNTRSCSSQPQVNAAMEANMNALWELAEAIHCDDASNLLTCMERCNAVEECQPRTETDSSDSRNNVTAHVEKIYAMLQDIETTDWQDAILFVAASFNRVAIARAILANNAANGVD
jgi:hypothetical protein